MFGVLSRLPASIGQPLISAAVGTHRWCGAHLAAMRIARANRLTSATHSPPFVDGDHQRIATARRGRMRRSDLINLGVDGYLWPVEAAKLYELAYGCTGDVLEIGTYRGLSAYVLSTALTNRGSGELHTCDIDKSSSVFARRALRWHRGRHCIRFHVDDACAFLDRQVQRRQQYGFIFVDHDHRYEPTRAVAERVPQLLALGGSVMFHDYRDLDAVNPAHPDKVGPAVDHTIMADARFTFCGVTGSSGVFRRVD